MKCNEKGFFDNAVCTLINGHNGIHMFQYVDGSAENYSAYTRDFTLLNANDYPKGSVVNFSLYRGKDESGVSGEGKVLEGVIFEDGLVVARWVAPNAPQSTVVYDCSGKEGEKPTTGFQKFLDIHVLSHPTNNTVIEFRLPDNTSKFVWIQPEAPEQEKVNLSFVTKEELEEYGNTFLTLVLRQAVDALQQKDKS